MKTMEMKVKNRSGFSVPSRAADKFVVRFHDDEMRGAISDRALSNRRSMNSEIISMLQTVLSTEDEGETSVEEAVQVQKISSAREWNPCVGALVSHKDFGVCTIKKFEPHKGHIIAVVVRHGNFGPISDVFCIEELTPVTFSVPNP